MHTDMNIIYKLLFATNRNYKWICRYASHKFNVYAQWICISAVWCNDYVLYKVCNGAMGVQVMGWGVDAQVLLNECYAQL